MTDLDFLSVADLEIQALRDVLDRAAAVKKAPRAVRGRLDGMKVGLFFEKPSTRTRVSSEVAIEDLGAHPVVLKADEVGLGKREAVEDVARVLDRYLDVLAFRVFHHSDLEVLADYAAAPVINLLSDLEHPCQALADLMTIAEHRPLQDTVLAYVGDGNNVAHSLMLAGAMTGMQIRVATPEGYGPHDDFVRLARRLGSAGGGTVEALHDPAAAVKDADVVYTDVWASMGQESETATRHELFADFQVSLSLFDTAASDAIFLHCLPAHRGEEVVHAVMEHDRSRVFDQAENRMHAFKALLLYLTAL